jgi:pilus assembly protein Flp/PilA
MALQMLHKVHRRPVSMPLLKLTEKENIMNMLKRLWQEEEGQDLVEYGLLVVLISLGCIAAMNGLATGISKAFSNAVAQLTAT